MLSSTSTNNESKRDNVKSTQNLRSTDNSHSQTQNLRQNRAMLSRPLNIEHQNQTQPNNLPQAIKKTTSTSSVLLPTQNLLNQLTTNEKKSDLSNDLIKRSIVQDDIENIQERLNEMLITAPTAVHEHETSLLPPEQSSTTEYFTPKVSVDEHGKKKSDGDDQSIRDDASTDDDDEVYPTTDEAEAATHPFFDILSSTSYEKEVMDYLLSLERRFVTENDKLRSDKRLRESNNTLKLAPTTIANSTNNSVVVITPKVRCKLIDWIISVHDYHRLNAAILCRTIHLIDRILLLNDQMTKLDLQLQAVNCFTIACKLESRRVPDANALMSLFDARHHITPIILNQGEKQLLTQLDFELEYPLAIHFLCYYLRFIPFYFVVYSMSKYMIECVLCDDQLHEQLPGSLLAAATLHLALKITGQIENPRTVKRFFKNQPYKREEIERRSDQIIKLMQQVPRSSYHNNVREKYKRSEFDRVANFSYSPDLHVPIA